MDVKGATSVAGAGSAVARSAQLPTLLPCCAFATLPYHCHKSRPSTSILLASCYPLLPIPGGAASSTHATGALRLSSSGLWARRTLQDGAGRAWVFLRPLAAGRRSAVLVHLGHVLHDDRVVLDSCIYTYNLTRTAPSPCLTDA
ncbi:hypothetical protein HMN09_01089300 [Mycena chlorophos]|uniref:Uncharacterized protein n=1 Tax=Mycena chlorophos TaxID=658473 RepID=A0A8H6VY75_MYCCL|nr:hypothetical protein HMN09_01089300 [Mycena chlorophos]